MNAFPFFVDLHGKLGILVGGGRVALRKAQTLSAFGCDLLVIAPEILPEFSQLSGAVCLYKCFCEEDLVRHPFFVIAATNSREENHSIARCCQSRDIPVNVADSEEESTFLFPSVISRGDLTIGISTGGTSPAAASFFRQRIEKIIPPNLEELLPFLARLRERAKRQIPAGKDRSEYIRRLSYLALEKGRPLTEEEMEDVK